MQTDNGLEFIGCVRKAGERASKQVANGFGVRDRRIAPGAFTWRSNGEAFDRLMEDEFCDIRLQ